MKQTVLHVGDTYKETTEYGKYKCRITKIDERGKTINVDYLTSKGKPFCSVTSIPFQFFEKDNITFKNETKKSEKPAYTAIELAYIRDQERCCDMRS